MSPSAVNGTTPDATRAACCVESATTEEDAAVLSILADLLEEIADMSGAVIDGGVLFKRHLAGKEAVHA